VGHRAGSDFMTNRKIVILSESNAGCPAQGSLSQYIILLWDTSYNVSPIDCPQSIRNFAVGHHIVVTPLIALVSYLGGWPLITSQGN
jgi:hypothetical protein